MFALFFVPISAQKSVSHKPVKNNTATLEAGKNIAASRGLPIWQ